MSGIMNFGRDLMGDVVDFGKEMVGIEEVDNENVFDIDEGKERVQDEEEGEDDGEVIHAHIYIYIYI